MTKSVKHDSEFCLFHQSTCIQDQLTEDEMTQMESMFDQAQALQDFALMLEPTVPRRISLRPNELLLDKNGSKQKPKQHHYHHHHNNNNNNTTTTATNTTSNQQVVH
jgi:hypothetical protein